jgi:predicted O-methyltransferase YrrM
MEPDRVLEEIERIAPSEALPILGAHKGRILDQVLGERQPKSAVEIGTLVGYSAIRIARLLPEGGKLTCLEINPEMAGRALSNLRRAGLDRKVEIVVGDARESARRLKGPIDLLLVDASKKEYLAYLRASEHLLHPGSIVVADNVKVFADQMGDYLDYVRGSGKYDSRTVESLLAGDPSATDAMEISVRR